MNYSVFKECFKLNGFSGGAQLFYTATFLLGGSPESSDVNTWTYRVFIPSDLWGPVVHSHVFVCQGVVQCS